MTVHLSNESRLYKFESMYRIPLIALSLLFLAGCAWDNEEDLLPEENACDTTNVSYAGDIVPILSEYCYLCHSNANAPDFASGIALEDYNDVAASSRLILGSIRHEAGYPLMPKDGSRLDSCRILTFEAWYNAGSPDN